MLKEIDAKQGRYRACRRQRVACLPGSLPASPLLVLLAMVLPATMADVKCYVIDAEHVSVVFLVEHIGFAKVLGRFLSVCAEYTFVEASGALGEVRQPMSECATIFGLR